MTDCGCENNNSGSITVQDLTDEIKEKLQEIATLSDGLVNIKEITSIAFIQNNKVFVLQSNDQQPINLLNLSSLNIPNTLFHELIFFNFLNIKNQLFLSSQHIT